MVYEKIYNVYIMPKNNTKRRYMKPRDIVKNKLCNKVPCGDCVKGCKPSYCVTNKQKSKNWCSHTSKLSGRSRKLIKNTNNSVYSNTLHKKMPYIWRFLDNKTRKKMIKLAKQPLNKINI